MRAKVLRRATGEDAYSVDQQPCTAALKPYSAQLLAALDRPLDIPMIHTMMV